MNTTAFTSAGTFVSLTLVFLFIRVDAFGQKKDSVGTALLQEHITDYLTNEAREATTNELQQLLDDSILDSLHTHSADSNTRSTYRLTLSQSAHRRVDLTRGFSRTYEEGGYSGSPTALFTRVDFQSSDGYSFRLALEKDPGESIRWDPGSRRYGFDHFTGALNLEKLFVFDNVVLGDYTLNWGRGLLFARSLSRSKNPVSSKRFIKARQHYRPLASRSESSAFRGGAASVQLFSVVRWSFFLSMRDLDASIYPDTTDHIRSIQKTGLHRTENELTTKGVLREKIRGSNVALSLNGLELALTGYEASFNTPFYGNPNPIEQFRFQGARLSGASVFVSYEMRRLLFSGEAAISNPGASAFVAGIHLSTGRKDDLIVIWRHYAPTYQVLYASGFGERTNAPKNETGLYAAYAMNISRHIKWSAFVDQYSFPWITSSILKPDSGIDFYSLLEYSPRTWLSAFILFRGEKKTKSSTFEHSLLRQLASASQLNTHFLRVQVNYIHSPVFQARTRVEAKWSTADEVGKNGMMMAQDLILNLNPRSKIHVRFSFFDTDGNESNLYAVEKDVRFRYSIKTFSGTGQRNFFIFKS